MLCALLMNIFRKCSLGWEVALCVHHLIACIHAISAVFVSQSAFMCAQAIDPAVISMLFCLHIN